MTDLMTVHANQTVSPEPSCGKALGNGIACIDGDGLVIGPCKVTVRGIIPVGSYRYMALISTGGCFRKVGQIGSVCTGCKELLIRNLLFFVLNPFPDRYM